MLAISHPIYHIHSPHIPLQYIAKFRFFYEIFGGYSAHMHNQMIKIQQIFAKCTSIFRTHTIKIDAFKNGTILGSESEMSNSTIHKHLIDKKSIVKRESEKRNQKWSNRFSFNRCCCPFFDFRLLYSQTKNCTLSVIILYCYDRTIVKFDCEQMRMEWQDTERENVKIPAQNKINTKM